VARKNKADAAGSDKIRKTRATGRSTAVKRSTSRKRKVVEILGEVVAASVEFDPTDEQIRTRAYFISERRRRFDLPGDADSDWLEARRQLLTETRH
jgi:DUF2934 family protein